MICLVLCKLIPFLFLLNALSAFPSSLGTPAAPRNKCVFPVPLKVPQCGFHCVLFFITLGFDLTQESGRVTFVPFLCHEPCETFVGSNGSQRPERGRPQFFSREISSEISAGNCRRGGGGKQHRKTLRRVSSFYLAGVKKENVC